MNFRWFSLAPLLGIVLAVTVAFSWSSAAQPDAAPRSGYSFLPPDLQQLQNDDFANPGMLWVEGGAELWAAPAGTAGQSCQSCHGDAGSAMRGVAVKYPQYSAEAGHVINLEQQINQCRTQRQKAEALPYESQELLGLTAFVANQSKGLPISIAVIGPAAESFARGKAFFYQRRGQLNLACSNCHEDNAGQHLRAESISQGQTNGFPIYRALWQTMGSSHRMFAWCNEAVRAEPFPAGAQEYVDLELFERWRSMGLKVETPAIRR